MNTTKNAILAALGLACSAAAQQITPGHVHYDLLYDRVSATGTVLGPGPLQEGEWARFRIRFTYSPEFGTPVTWPSSILAGSSGAGTLLGFWSGWLDVTSAVISGPGDTQGAWSGVTAGSLPVRRMLIAPFNAANSSAGTPMSGGTALRNLTPNQFVGTASGVNTTNNFIVWQGAWRPNDYAPRTAEFSLAPGTVQSLTYLVARDNNPSFELPVAGMVPYTRGSVEFQIVPPPSGGAVFGMAMLLVARRRRDHLPPAKGAIS